MWKVDHNSLEWCSQKCHLIKWTLSWGNSILYQKKKKGSEQRVTSIISVANYLSNQKYNKILKNDWLSPTQFELP